MNKIIQVSIAVLLIAGLLYTITTVSTSQPENEMANLAQAAFISLDAKVTRSSCSAF